VEALRIPCAGGSLASIMELVFAAHTAHHQSFGAAAHLFWSVWALAWVVEVGLAWEWPVAEVPVAEVGVGVLAGASLKFQENGVEGSAVSGFGVLLEEHWEGPVACQKGLLRASEEMYLKVG